jgi:hypothetical protein
MIGLSCNMAIAELGGAAGRELLLSDLGVEVDPEPAMHVALGKRPQGAGTKITTKSREIFKNEATDLLENKGSRSMKKRNEATDRARIADGEC